MACWRGVCRVGRGWLAGGGAGEAIAEAKPECGGEGRREGPESTWTAPPPSPAYLLAKGLDQRAGGTGRAIPPDLLDRLKDWRENLLAEQACPASPEAPKQRSGPEPAPPERFEVVTTEEGSGHRRARAGDTVSMGYALVLEEGGAVLDMRPELDYRLGARARAGQLDPGALERTLLEMKHGQITSVTSSLRQLLAADAPALGEHGPEATAVLEVKLFQIHTTGDCSFTKGAGDVIKEVVKEGLGAWCDNPTDEGQALLRIEEVRDAGGARLFPGDGAGALELRVTPGNGEVCDALECAMLEMRRHETALVKCEDPGLCAGGAPRLPAPPEGGFSLRVTLLDYSKGPDAWEFDEEDRLAFGLRRKEEAARLFGEGRFRLARERYRRVEELFHHLNRPKSGDRFLGRPELYEACKDLRKACRLNVAACSLRLADPLHAKRMCDAVLKSEPENVKALYRRGQAHVQRGDYVQACNDLERLLDISSNLEEARRLLERARRLREASDRKQRKHFNYNRMIDKMRTDPRSIVHDYMDTPVDLPDVEGTPIAARFQPRK